ncbi:hypothetical protein ABKV19_025594, partial [Rosa sericea]
IRTFGIIKLIKINHYLQYTRKERTGCVSHEVGLQDPSHAYQIGLVINRIH